MPDGDDKQIQWMNDQIAQARQSGMSDPDIQAKIMARPELAEIYGRMPPIVPRTWGQTITREARLGAEQLALGVPSAIAAPGNINVLLNRQFGVPVWPHFITSQDVAGWGAGAEQYMFGANPLTPQTPAERIYAGTMQGVGGALPTLGLPAVGIGANLATRALAGGATGGGAAAATQEYLPQLGPLAPAIAGTLAGSVVGGPGVSVAERVPAAARYTQDVGSRLGIAPATAGPRSYLNVLNDYDANPALWPTQNVIPPGLSKTEAGTNLQNQLNYNLRNPAAVPGTGGVPGTNLSPAQVNQLQGYKSGGAFLKGVEGDRSIAAEFAADPTMQGHMRTAAGANLALNADKNIPRLDKAGTLEHFYGADTPIVRQAHARIPTAPTMATQHADIMRLLRTEAVTTLAPVAFGGFAHIDPTLTAAMTTIGAAAPVAAHLYTRYPQAIGGMGVGGAIGGAAGLEVGQ